MLATQIQQVWGNSQQEAALGGQHTHTASLTQLLSDIHITHMHTVRKSEQEHKERNLVRLIYEHLMMWGRGWGE